MARMSGMGETNGLRQVDKSILPVERLAPWAIHRHSKVMTGEKGASTQERAYASLEVQLFMQVILACDGNVRGNEPHVRTVW